MSVPPYAGARSTALTAPGGDYPFPYDNHFLLPSPARKDFP
jgi:hypothetical protein